MADKSSRGKGEVEQALITHLRKKPCSVTELVKLIPDANHWAIRKAVERMEKRAQVIKIEERKSADTGRTEAVYLYVGTVPITEFFQELDTAETEQAAAKKDVVNDVVYQIVQDALYDPDFDEEKRRDYFGKLAQAFTMENPRELLFRFANWLNKEHERAVAAYESALDGKSAKGELEKNQSKIEHIERLARVIFNRNLGIPFKVDEEDGPFHIRYKKRDRKREWKVDENEIRHYLDMAVLGKTVMEKALAERPRRGFCEAGTDASLRKFDLTPFRSAFDHTRMAIVTAASVRTSFYDSKDPQIDVKPEPKEWRYYTEDDAVDKGLLIPPDAYLMLDDLIWERVTSASQNLRQYHKDLECFLQDEVGRIPDVLFRDGRIFPLEHLFDDYCQAGIHGRVVRKSIEAFRDLVEKVSASYPNLAKPVYAGAVKRPDVTILSPLAFWYMKYGSEKPIWPNMDDRKFIFRTPLSDQRVAHYLFAALTDELNQDERWITCRFARRFVSMDDKIARSLSYDYKEWLDFLQKEAEKRPAEPDVEPYAQLCAGAAVSAFYVSLPKGTPAKSPEDYLTPRYEVLLPRQLVGTEVLLEQILHYDSEVVAAILRALADPTGLDIYPDKLDAGNVFQKAKEPIFIFPKATTLAHENVKMAGAVYEMSFTGYLWKIVIEVMKAARRRSALGT